MPPWDSPETCPYDVDPVRELPGQCELDGMPAKIERGADPKQVDLFTEEG